MGDNGSGDGKPTAEQKMAANTKMVADALKRARRRKKIAGFIGGVLFLAAVVSVIWAGFSLDRIADGLESVAKSMRSIATIGGGQ